MVQYPDAPAALARVRAATLPAQAQASRRSSLARAGPRHLAPAGPVTLRDGSTVLIRPVRGTDVALLADGYARLSPRSRRMRFLTGKAELSATELRYLTDVDHRDHEALVALSDADGRGVGIARYVRDRNTPRTAEVAVTVVDEWQRRGLGTVLLTRLAHRAVQEGICRFTGLVAAGNVAMAGLSRQFGAAVGRWESGAIQYEIALAGHEDATTAPARGTLRT